MIAKTIKARMVLDTKHPKSNLFVYKNRRAGIKSAALKTAGVKVLQTMIDGTDLTIVAFEKPKNAWQIYSLRSNVIPHIGLASRQPANSWHLGRAVVKAEGKLIGKHHANKKAKSKKPV